MSVRYHWIIGSVDSERASRITSELLDAVGSRAIRTVIVDFTGIAVQVMTNNGKIANQNGSNCTRGGSYFSDPCKIRKVGAAHLLYNAVKKPRNDKGAPVPLYVNLVLAASQEYGGSYHGSDKVKIVNGSIDIRRYPADYSR